jgi:predicted NAD/FAD-binding protein
MCAFPHLSELYSTWKSFVEEQGKGSTRIITCREVTRVKRSRRGVDVWSRPTQGTSNSQYVVEPGRETKEVFDEIVFCCDADAALQILGTDATLLEKKILGNVKVSYSFTYF